MLGKVTFDEHVMHWKCIGKVIYCTHLQNHNGCQKERSVKVQFCAVLDLCFTIGKYSETTRNRGYAQLVACVCVYVCVRL